MGFAGRKPILPAATESLLGSNLDAEHEYSQPVEEVATDLSVKTDRTHHTIPDDGRPITITTGNRTTGKIFKTDNHSQTSLLIEYFEAGNSNNPGQKPSIRVKVHPSKASRNNSAHILLKQGHGVTQDSVPTSTRKISLLSKSPRPVAGLNDAAVPSVPDIPNHSSTVETEVDNRPGHGSDPTTSPGLRYAEATSDISSMPPDSMLGAQRSTLVSASIQPLAPSDPGLPTMEDSTYNQAVTMDTTALKPPAVPQERNLSSERLTQKVIEKLSNRPRDIATPERSRNQRLSSSAGREVTTGLSSHPTRVTAGTGRAYKDDDSMLSVSAPSMLSNSAVYPDGKAYDQRSSKSIVSNNSLQNNPKLLQTVEDVIKRLILPELKEIKKDQRHATHRSKYDKDHSDLSTSTASLDKTTRRVSSGSKSRRRTSKDAGSTPRRRSDYRDSYGYDSLSDGESYKYSVSSVSDHKQRRRHKDHYTRDLPGPVLELKQSEGSVDLQRRKRRSRSRSSKSASIAESDEAFTKHKLPLMPMQSEIGSELTRSSLLSSNTTGSSAPTQREVREVTRGSQAMFQPSVATQSENTSNMLGMHHGNFSEHNLSTNKFAHEQSDNEGTVSPEVNRYQFDNELLEDPERMRQYERNLHTQHPIRRGLSPIQSVASYTTTEPHRNFMIHPKSIDSFASTRRGQDALMREVSLNSLASASPDFKIRDRPQGISLENRSEIMEQHGLGPAVPLEPSSRGASHDFSRDSQDVYRDSFTTDDRTPDGRLRSELTDDTSDAMYVNKITAGQTVKGGTTNSAYIMTPPGVESAVASLIEPSVLSMQESSLSDSTEQHNRSRQSPNRDLNAQTRSSPLKRQGLDGGRVGVEVGETHLYEQPKLYEPNLYTRDLPGQIEQRVNNLSNTNMARQQGSSQSQTSLERHKRMNVSPPQSPALSLDQTQAKHERHVPLRDSLNSDVTHGEDLKESPRSEIITNPSIIHGPIGGHDAGQIDPWMHNALRPPFQDAIRLDREFSSGAIDLIPEGLNVSQRNTFQTKPNTYVIGQPNLAVAMSPSVKHDEGYATGDNLPSPFPNHGNYRNVAAYNIQGGFVDDQGEEDPFTVSNKKGLYMSGLSQGMSPIYDSATGKGIDRIQSKDIIALMDHLTVRDSQRNARDTEILVTLVRSAADMRNSFEEMKAYIAGQNELNMNVSDKQHAQTQKAIGGPRSAPGRTSLARNSASQEDIPTKRQNVFKRALANLGSKNTAELQNIESMLMQLLDEVEALRMQTGMQPLAPGQVDRTMMHDRSLGDNVQEAQHGDSAPATATMYQGQYGATRRTSQNRVSTVIEQDEAYDPQDDRYNEDGQATPRAVSPVSSDEENYRSHARGKTVPFNTPPRNYGEDATPRSDENTPYNAARDSKDTQKHKSFASSLLPKMVSRWSKTTTSTEPVSTPYRGSTQTHMQSKHNRQSDASQSGDAVYQYQYEQSPDDKLRSTTSLQDGKYYPNDENRPPSPLVPSAISPAEPKYHGHRDSQNIISPQPRQGPTGRYQFHLENAAQTYDPVSPVSQRADMWQQQQQQHLSQHLSPTSARSDNPSTFRMNAPPSPIPDVSYSPTPSDQSGTNLSRRNARKQTNNEPLVPRREHKITSPTTYIDEVRAARAGSPGFDRSPINNVKQQGTPGRKPSGPRPLSRTSDHGLEKRTRFANSPIHSEDGY